MAAQNSFDYSIIALIIIMFMRRFVQVMMRMLRLRMLVPMLVNQITADQAIVIH